MCKLLTPLLVTALAVGLTAPQAKAQIDLGSGVVIDSIDFEDVEIVDGVLTGVGGTVSGTIAGLPFTTIIDEFTIDLLPPGDPAGCSILHLELAPIDIDLLGLHVDTSAICLSITSTGEGLLGDLLCDIAGGNLLGLNQLLDALTGILGNAMNDQPGPSQGGAEDICDGECEILDLALGPVDLTLLGINVHLDDCDDGPVQVCVSASAGEGLLGDLLCGLAGGGGLGDILSGLGVLEDLLGALSGILDDLEGLDARPQDVNRLTNQLGRALEDGALSDKELDKLVKQITKLLR